MNFRMPIVRRVRTAAATVAALAFAALPASAQIITGWDANGVPQPLSQNVPVNSETFQGINLALPERQDIRLTHPEYIATDDRSRLTLTELADVYVTFVHEGAGYRNSLGCFFYDAANPPTSPAEVNHEIIFPNTSYRGSGGGLRTGNTVHLGELPAGTSIGFWLRANGWNGSGVSDTGWIHYSLSSLNEEDDAELRRHTALLWRNENQDLVLGFEDILRTNPSCDQDFNDVVFLISATPSTAIDTTELVALPGIEDQDGDGVSDYLDAYPADAERAAVQFTPSVSNSEVLAYEDKWPHVGDYDFNDLVLGFQYREVLDASGGIKEFSAEFIPVARGAAVHSGFALQLEVPGSDIESVELWVDEAPVSAAEVLQSSGGTSVLRLFNDAHLLLPSPPDGQFANTVPTEPQVSGTPVEVRVVFQSPVERSVLGLPPYNPFIFRRDWPELEVHLLDQPPSPFGYMGYFGAYDDASDPAAGKYYRDAQNYPWAMILPTDWLHPRERAELSWGYPGFVDWVVSDGTTSGNWHRSNRQNQFLWVK